MDKFVYEECKICKEKNVEPSHFWKEHRLKELNYCWTYEPRHSLLTKQLIKFKSRDFYFNSDFNDKNELKKWIKENPDKALEYCIGLLERRKNEGKLAYTPSQVELRSICSPNILWYEKNCNYNLECDAIGLKTRFKYLNLPEFTYKHFPLNITIDTREQKPLKFPGANITVHKLEYGDYWCSNSEWTNVYFERKGLTDFIGTLSNGYERFEREIERALTDHNYLIIIVEEEIGKAMAFNMLPHVSSKIKASPDFVFHRVRMLMQKYPNIQFVFADGRGKAVELITKISLIKTDPTIIDWQFAIDKKLI